MLTRILDEIIYALLVIVVVVAVAIQFYYAGRVAGLIEGKRIGEDIGTGKAVGAMQKMVLEGDKLVGEYRRAKR